MKGAREPTRNIGERLAGTLLAAALLVTWFPGSTLASPVHEQIVAGDRAFARGSVETAIASWTAAYEAALEERNASSVAIALAKRAEGYRSLGFYSRAIADLEEALALSADDPPLTAAMRGSLGTVYALAGRFEAAEIELGACLAGARQNDDPRLAARAHNSLGMLHERQGFASAAGEYALGHALALESGDLALALQAQVNQARTVTATEGHEAARALRHDAGTAALALPDTQLKAVALLTLAGLAIDATEAGAPGAKREARTLIGQAQSAIEQIDDDRARSFALGYRARLAHLEGSDTDALALAGRALTAARLAGAPDAAYRWQWLTGRILAEGGRTDQAVEAYRAAVVTLHGLRGAIDGSFTGSRSEFERDVRRVYTGLVDLLLTRSDQADAQTRQLLFEEARGTMELLKAAELENYYEDDCVSALRARTRDVEQLSATAAALYPLFVGQRVELLLALPGSTLRFTVEASRDDVEAVIARYRDLLVVPSTNQYRRPARRLYEWMIAPIVPSLDGAGIDTLVVVPDGPLRTVPIAALYDGERHLVERYALALAPGVGIIDPRPLPRGDAQLLIAGLTESVQGFPALPNVEAEVRDIESMLGGRLMLDGAFRSEALQSALGANPFTVVHLASHAEFAARASDSFVLTYDGRISMDNLEQFVKLGRFRDRPVELITLSGCKTAFGDERAALGLAGLAVKAGARSALATLWEVRDDAARILMTTFYSELGRSGVTKAEALRRAQLVLIADARYRRPFHWAPFLIIGNWL